MTDHDFQSDARLEALLDEALSPDGVPGGVPADLNARILAALPLHELRAEPQPAVVGRIGFFASVTVRRIAAAVVVVMGVGATILAIGAMRNASLEATRLAQEKAAKEAAQQLAIANLSHELDRAPVTLTAARDLHNTTLATSESTLDRSIDTLKHRADHAAMTAAVDSWVTTAQSLEAELDALDAELF